MERIVWSLIALFSFALLVYFLMETKLCNDERFRPFRSILGYLEWRLRLAHFILVGILYFFTPIDRRILHRRGAFITNSVLQLTPTASSAFFLKFLEQENLFDGNFICVCVLMVLQNLCISRIMWPGIDLSDVGLYMDLSLSMAFLYKKATVLGVFINRSSRARLFSLLLLFFFFLLVKNFLELWNAGGQSQEDDRDNDDHDVDGGDSSTDEDDDDDDSDGDGGHPSTELQISIDDVHEVVTASDERRKRNSEGILSSDHGGIGIPVATERGPHPQPQMCWSSASPTPAIRHYPRPSPLPRSLHAPVRVDRWSLNQQVNQPAHLAIDISSSPSPVQRRYQLPVPEASPVLRRRRWTG